MTSVLRTARVVLLGAPLLWLVPALLHPMGEPYAGIADEADRWIFVHVAQLVLAPFLAAGVWMLLAGLESVAAQVARAALVLWLVFFSAFDAVAGIATGVLTRHANTLAGQDREGVVSAIDFLFDDSQLAGGGFSVLGNLGHFSWVIVAIAASVALYRAGAPRAVVVATSLSVLFASHSGLGARNRAGRSVRRRAAHTPRSKRRRVAERDAEMGTHLGADGMTQTAALA